jgi:hypothetical protein
MQADDLDTRLAALEARAPAGDGPPDLGRRGRRGRLVISSASAPILVLLLAVTVAVGGVVVSSSVGQAPGAENPGQPLYGANLECMTPPAAAAYLTAHGFTHVVWQVEAGSNDKHGTSVQQATAPEHGYVVPASFIDGVLYIVVDQRVGATGTEACPNLPMP